MELSKKGITMFAIHSIVQAIKDNDEGFFSTPVGEACLDCMGDATGVTLRQIKDWIKQQTKDLAVCAELLADSSSMTARELADKYHWSISAVNSYLNYRNIKPKKSTACADGEKSVSEYAEIIKTFKGELTSTEIATKLGLSIKKVQNICYYYKIPYLKNH